MRRAPSPILLVTPVSADLGSTPVLPQVRAAGVGWGQVGCMSGTCSTGFGRAQGAAVTPHGETWDWNLRQSHGEPWGSAQLLGPGGGRPDRPQSLCRQPGRSLCRQKLLPRLCCCCCCLRGPAGLSLTKNAGSEQVQTGLALENFAFKT